MLTPKDTIRADGRRPGSPAESPNRPNTATTAAGAWKGGCCAPSVVEVRGGLAVSSRPTGTGSRLVRLDPLQELRIGVVLEVEDRQVGIARELEHLGERDLDGLT